MWSESVAWFDAVSPRVPPYSDVVQPGEFSIGPSRGVFQQNRPETATRRDAEFSA